MFLPFYDQLEIISIAQTTVEQLLKKFKKDDVISAATAAPKDDIEVECSFC